MTADLLRRAAAQMRERAEAATPSPWWNESGTIHAPHPKGEPGAACHPADCQNGNGVDPDADGEHIASWHPDVALAVANWLDTAGADLWAYGLHCTDGCAECDDDIWAPHVRRALVLARKYLGDPA